MTTDAVRRQPEALAAALENHPRRHVGVMDGADEDRVKSAVAQAIARFGRDDRRDVTLSKDYPEETP